MLLAPLEPSTDPEPALAAASGEAVWECMLRGRNIAPGDVLVSDTVRARPSLARPQRNSPRVAESVGSRRALRGPGAPAL